MPPFHGLSSVPHTVLMATAESMVMKTRVFADDGQPESWDCNDNYFDLDEIAAREHMLQWARSSAKRQGKEPALSPSLAATTGRSAGTEDRTIQKRA
ncbi:MAG: hypothetical protein ACI8WY_003127 [Planctomycetota bacterium]|jgi:hypothetical protein